MKKIMKKIMNKGIQVFVVLAILAMVATPITVLAAAGTGEADTTAVTTEEADTDNAIGDKALAAGLGVGIAAAGGAIGMGMAISKSAEGISRQPEAEGKIRTILMLGLVFVETAIIYALVIAILIIFVL